MALVFFFQLQVMHLKSEGREKTTPPNVQAKQMEFFMAFILYVVGVISCQGAADFRLSLISTNKKKNKKNFSPVFNYWIHYVMEV